jgi:TM2 domain-containing membrane protein YozV/type II secretory pathway pseudopilin PulG
MEQNSNCKKCGNALGEQVNVCSTCGLIQDTFYYKSRVAAASLAIFGGIFGAHRFYLGKWWGIFYLLFFWTYIPWLVGLIEGIVFLSTSQENWNEKYNQGISAGSEKGTVVVVLAVIVPAVAIIGVIAAVALPAYQDFTFRAKVSEAITISSNARLAVAEYAIREQQWPENHTTVGVEANPQSKYVSSIEIDKGVIYVNMNADSGITGAVVYVPSYSETGIDWSCKESTIPSKYLPATCR